MIDLGKDKMKKSAFLLTVILYSSFFSCFLHLNPA